MRQHQVRSQIHDGLKHLSNAEIIAKVVESPTKLKKHAKGFLIQLNRHKVTLDENGDPDFSKVKNAHVLKLLKKKEQLVRLTLMQADMEFEYPQKLEKIIIKSNILNWLNDEEEKIRALVRQAESDRSVMSQQVAITPGDEFYLTVEDYYGFKVRDGSMSGVSTSETGQDRKISFKKFVETRASENIFDHDVSANASLIVSAAASPVQILGDPGGQREPTEASLDRPQAQECPRRHRRPDCRGEPRNQ